MGTIVPKADRPGESILRRRSGRVRGSPDLGQQPRLTKKKSDARKAPGNTLTKNGAVKNDDIHEPTQGKSQAPNCVNLGQRFGDRFRVEYEESYRVEHGDHGRAADPWLMILLCQHGHICPWGGGRDHATEVTEAVVGIAEAGRSREAPGVIATIHPAAGDSLVGHRPKKGDTVTPTSFAFS